MKQTKVTIADIARKLDISPTTISFVLNGRDNGISEATRETVLRTASEMGYRKSVLSGNASGWTKIAYVTSEIEYFNSATSFFAHVYNHLQKRSQSDKFDLFLLELDPDESFINCKRRIDEFRNIGIEICLAHSVRVAEALQASGFKTILVQNGVMPDCVCVYCDDYAAGREAALHALAMGHRKAGMIFPDSSHPRFKGFLESFTAGGGICDSRFFWSVSWNHEEAATLIEQKAVASHKLPTIFYCFADNIVFPALRGFTKAGFRIPDEISLIGTDNLYWGAVTMPAFTTVDLNEELFADKISAAVSHVKNNGAPYHLAVPVRLIARETVKKINGR